jgi:hypothetical protein
MTRAQCLQFATMSDQLLDLFNSLGLVKPGSLISVITGPIAWILDHLYVPLMRHKIELLIADLWNNLRVGVSSLYSTDKYTLRVESQFLESFAKKECSVYYHPPNYWCRDHF